MNDSRGKRAMRAERSSIVRCLERISSGHGTRRDLQSLGSLVEALQRGEDANVLLGLEPGKRGKPRNPQEWERNVERIARMWEILNQGIATRGGKSITEYDAAVKAAEELPGVSVETLLENHWQGKGRQRPENFMDVRYSRDATRRITKLRYEGVRLAHDRAEEAAEPPSGEDWENPGGKEFREDPVRRN